MSQKSVKVNVVTLATNPVFLAILVLRFGSVFGWEYMRGYTRVPYEFFVMRVRVRPNM